MQPTGQKMVHASDSPVPEAHWPRWAALVLVTLAGAALRIHDLTRHSLWYDESVFGYYATLFWNPVAYFDPHYGTEPPLQVFLFGGWYRLVMGLPFVDGHGSALADALVRALPCAAGIASIPLTYALARRISNDTPASLMASALVALSPFQIYYAQEFRAYTTLVVFGILSALVLHAALEGKSRWWWPLLALIWTLAVAHQTFMVWYIMAFNLYFTLLLPRYWRKLHFWIAANLAVVVATTLFLDKAFYMSGNLASATIPWFPNPTPATMAITFKNFFAGYGDSRIAYWAITGLAGVLLLMGLWKIRKNVPQSVFLMCFAFLPIAINGHLWASSDAPYYTHRMLILSGIPCALLVAHGIRLAPRAAQVFMGTLFVAATVPLLADTYAQRLHPVEDHLIGAQLKIDTRGAAEWVRPQVREGDAFIHRATITTGPLRHYLPGTHSTVEFTRRNALGNFHGLPDFLSYAEADLIPVPLLTAIGDAKRVWYFQSSWTDYQDEFNAYAIRAWLDAHGRRVAQHSFFGADVFLYEEMDVNWPRLTRNEISNFGQNEAPFSPGDPLQDPALLVSERQPSHTFGVRFATAVVDGEWNGSNFTPNGRPSVATGETFEHIGNTWTLLGPHEDHALAVAIPLENSGNPTGYVEIVNPSNVSHTFIFAAAAAPYILSAMDFRPSNPDSSIWAPSPTIHDRPFASGNPMAYSAALHGNSTGDDGIAANVDVIAGVYRVYLRCGTAPSETNAWAAEGQVSLLQGDMTVALTPILPTDPRLPADLPWINIGEVSLEDGPVRVEAAARNPHNLKNAYFSLSAIALVPGPEGENVSTAWPGRPFTFTAPPGRSTFPFEATPGRLPQRQFAFEFIDPVSKLRRTLSFTAENNANAGGI